MSNALEAHLDKLISPASVLHLGDQSARDLIPLGRFDLAIGLDMRAMPYQAARGYVKELVEHTDVVLWSPAVPANPLDSGTGEWPSWWASIFSAYGFGAYDLLRRDLWWDQRIDWRHRQNMLVFASDEAAAARGWEREEHVVDLAQPALLMPELDRPLWATVCIPWRPSPSRMAAFERVQSYWAQFGWPVITADSDTEVFSLAQARNNAVAQAKTDVVVVADADTVLDPLNVLRAVADPTGICWPFTNYRVLDAKYIDTPYEQLIDVPYISTWGGDGAAGVGGCLVAKRSEYWRLGGQPPEFIGWGWEDTAFTLVVRTLSTVKRAAGYLYAFEHNTDCDAYVNAKADSDGWDRDVSRNEHLMKPYVACDMQPWKMRHLIKSRRVEG